MIKRPLVIIKTKLLADGRSREYGVTDEVKKKRKFK